MSAMRCVCFVGELCWFVCFTCLRAEQAVRAPEGDAEAAAGRRGREAAQRDAGVHARAQKAAQGACVCLRAFMHELM